VAPEAEIASLHAAAPSFAEAAGGAIASAYQALSPQPSPVVTLSHAVAMSYAESPAAALALRASPPIRRWRDTTSTPPSSPIFTPLAAIMRPRAHLERAHTLAPTTPERNLLAYRLSLLP
jgi:predicted RNA polymerase sigma factor